MPAPADLANYNASFSAPSKDILAKDDEAGGTKIPENDIIKAIDAAQEMSAKDKNPESKSAQAAAKKFPDVTSAIAHISSCLEAGNPCFPDQCNKPTKEIYKEVIEIEIEVSAKDEDFKFMRKVAKEATAYLKKAKHTPEKIANKPAPSSPTKLAKLQQRLGNSSNKIGFNVEKSEAVNKPSTLVDAKNEAVNKPSTPVDAKNEAVNKPSTLVDAKNEAVNKPSTLVGAFTAASEVKDSSANVKPVDCAPMDTIEIIDSPEKPAQVIDVDEKDIDPPAVNASVIPKDSTVNKQQEQLKETDIKDPKNVSSSEAISKIAPTTDGKSKEDGESKKRKHEDDLEEPVAKVVKVTEKKSDVIGDNNTEHLSLAKKTAVMFGILYQEYL